MSCVRCARFSRAARAIRLRIGSHWLGIADSFDVSAVHHIHQLSGARRFVGAQAATEFASCFECFRAGAEKSADIDFLSTGCQSCQAVKQVG